MTSKWNEIMIRFGTTTLCAVLLSSGLPARGLEKTTPPEANDAAANAAETVPTQAESESTFDETTTNEPITNKRPESKTTAVRGSSPSQDIVEFGRPVELKAGQTVQQVLLIGNSAMVHGKVRGDLVVIGGNITLDGEVGRDVVAIMGSVNLGTNANVRGDVVAVMGGIKLQPGAQLRDAVAIGGRVDRPEGAEIRGQVISLTLPGLGWLANMGDWVSECIFKLRPLSFKVAWVWVASGVFLLLYLLVALAFPRPVEACVEEITRRPATTLLMGLLTKILIPIVTLILLATGIGILIVPFLGAAVFVAGVVGKVALLAYFGRQLARSIGASALQHLLAALLIGWMVITLLYVVPVLGLVVYFVTGMWALGAAVTATFGGMRREMPGRPAPSSGTPAPASPVTGLTPPAPAPPVAAVSVPPVSTSPAGLAPISLASTPSAATSSAASGTANAPDTAASAPSDARASQTATSNATAALPDALAYPRASFWERMGAAFLDLVLVGVVSGMVSKAGGSNWGGAIALAYFAGMWTWKGTTVGGIVLNLKVVRLDGSPMTFAVALVRGLAAAFSAIVGFLGFLWIIWDKEKQGWHDRIAGTVVVRLPRGLPLVCL